MTRIGEQQIDNESSREDHILTPMLVNDFDGVQ